MRSALFSRKRIKTVIIVIILIGVLIQLYRPKLDNPPVTADMQAEPEARAIIKRACYDCHSNETRLAWFDEPAPAYWLVVKDVREGRKVLNFSTFDSLPKAAQAAKWFESIMQIEQQAMPLASYKAMHSGGKVSAAELEVLKKYALTLAYKAKPDTARTRAALDQYATWMKCKPGAQTAVDEYNGIGYKELSGFRDWKAVSTTERYDNGTLRLILGNDIAVRAIRKGHTNPWPDGAIFAKIALDQLPDSSGLIRAGVYRQVEFMIRDSHKYASSFGWGFARWVGGLTLKPYGKNASFVNECMNCHRPLKANDYTFTIPLADTLRLFDPAADANAASDASLEDVVGKPMTGKVISCMVDSRKGTQSILYGNDKAAEDARQGKEYEDGAVLSLVTWAEREDPHWFGGRIPKDFSQVEVVSFGTKPAYKLYTGYPLREAEADSVRADRQIKFMTGIRAAVLP